MFEHILLCSWQPSSPFQGGCPPFSSFLFTWTLAFSVSAVTWPFYLRSIGNHSLLGALIKETWYFSYMLSRHLTKFSACSGVGGGVKTLVSHWSALQWLSPGKAALEESSSKSYCFSPLKHHLSTPDLAQNSNENSGICKLVLVWRIETFESEFSLYKGWLQLMGSDHSLLQKGGSLCLNGLAAIHILLLALQLQISIT